jgi:site-specific recombinase XerD
MLQTERTCDDVFDSFLHYCEMRVAGGDMAFSTLNGYRKILKSTWRPKLSAREFKSVVYSELVKIATSQGWKTKKTYNNGISPLRYAFAFGYKDHPEKPNPAEGLDSFRITRKDRPKIDPFTIHEAESLIRGIRQVIVLAREKDRTKTKEDRTVELCPRALSVLKRQLALREQYLQAGKIDHDFVFFKDDGEPIRSLKYPYMRWRYVMEKLGLRYRDPYTARHSCVS